ncbi:pyridoxal-dependent decarboxylase, partial [bacterium]|nr:pyridoxal-dependent decarboxylase [bacterium]
MASILADIDRVVLPGMTHWNHPSYFAYFSSTGSGPGILGELIGAALNNNGMLWKSCPSSTELEQVTLDWLRQMLGLPEKFWGMIYDTGSMSSLHAIAAAREQLADLRIREEGLTDAPKLRLYASEHAHSSIDKAVVTLGMGLRGIRKIPANSEFRMRPDDLQAAIAEDREQGYRPFCVVATAGTTSCASVDPLEPIASICERENLWLHVDAAYAGSTTVIPEMRDQFRGWERADSILINPHKWLFVPIDLSVLYTSKREILKNAFSLVPEYLRTKEDSEVENYMDYGVSLGRRFRALKFWFVLRYFGRNGLAARIQGHIDIVEQFAKWVDDHPLLQLMAPVAFSLVCFRARPENIHDPDALDRFNEEFLEAINSTRDLFLSHTKLNGSFVLRFAVGNIRTEERHVLRAWDIISEQLDLCCKRAKSL